MNTSPDMPSTRPMTLRQQLELKLSAKRIAHTPLGDTEILNAGPIVTALLPIIERYSQEIAREARLDELLTVCEESVFDYQYKPDVWTKGAACMSKQWLDERIAELTQKPAGGVK